MEMSSAYVYPLHSYIPAVIYRLRTLHYFGSATFMIFACACFGAYLWSSYVVPETAGVSLEEIDAVFGSAAGQKDRKRKCEVGDCPA